MPEFSELDGQGRVVRSRTISSGAVRRCPHLIMVPEHYRDDESCRCDDPWHTNMLEWGYHWQDGQWVSPEKAR